MVDVNGRRYGTKARGYRAVLVTIADAANRDGEHAHPGLPAMIDGSLYSRRQVIDIVKALVADGWVTVEEEGRGRGHATVYSVDMGTVQPPHLSAIGNGAISDEERCSLDAVKVQSDESAPLSSTDTTKPTTRVDLDEAAFEEWWKLYPLKKAKPAALAKYRVALKAVGPAVLLEGVKRYAAERAGQDPTFTAHAATWLHNKRWADEPVAVKRPANVNNFDNSQARRDQPGGLVPNPLKRRTG